MQFDFNFHSSLLLITFSNGLVYSVLLLKKAVQTKQKSNYWLSLFVLLCSLYVAPWMLGFAGWYDQQPYRNFMFYVPFQQLFLVGPVLFFYIQTLLNPSFRLQKKHVFHFVPAAFYIIYIAFLFVYDHFIASEIYFYANGMDKDFDPWYQAAGQLSMFFYFAICLRYYVNYKKLVFEISSNAEKLVFRWIQNYLIAFALMLVLPLVFELIGYFQPSIKSYVGSWWFYLFYSVLLFYIAVTGYSNSAVTQIGFHFRFQNQNMLYYLTDNIAEPTIIENIIDIDHVAIDDIDDQALLYWKTLINNMIVNENLYKNPELSLPEIAKKLQTTIALVSKSINQGFEMNFNDFINSYRIQAVKNAFAAGEHKKSTLLGIAYDCGFNSKATFNRAFKKNTGVTPKAYISKL